MDLLEQQAATLGERMLEKGWWLASAESCTGGWVAQTVTAVAGSSGWFDRAFVTYSNEAKQDMLGVSQQTLLDQGAVSEAVVLEMAQGALDKSRADLSVAISGVAGPGGGTTDKPVGTVWFAWGSRTKGVKASCHRLFGDREQVRRQAVRIALDELGRLCRE